MNGTGKMIIIVGAGIAGLTLADRLSRDGEDVLVVEKESHVGGLAKSFAYDGFVFDVGPHRFHTESPEVNSFIHEVLDGDYLTIERKSGVWMFDRYFDWPLTLSSIVKMPKSVLASVGLDLLRIKPKDGDSFEDYVVSRYGKTLFEIFFKPYTEKFLKIPCSQVSRDWAETGIERAVLDKKIRTENLAQFAKSVLLSGPPLRFIYPGTGGIGVFSEKIAQRLADNGVSVLLNAEVTGVEIKSNRIVKALILGKEYACDRMVWTGSITGVLSLFGRHNPGLEYLALLLFNYQISHEPITDHQWSYFGDRGIPFNRTSIPSLFNPSLSPPGSSGICAEVTCAYDDAAWRAPESYEYVVRKSLAAVGLIKGVDSILGCNIEKIRHAYPIYKLDYRDKLKAALDITGTIGNLTLLGRTGAFWYNNMDHSIAAALKLYREIRGVRD